MKVGEVFYWNTTSVTGRDHRNKYHIFVCDDRDGGDHLFFFINKVVWDGDFVVTVGNCPFLEFDPSYVSMAPISYTNAELAVYQDNPVHALDRETLHNLALHVQDSRVIERFEKQRICVALTRRCTELI